jgi:hypothetical protein
MTGYSRLIAGFSGTSGFSGVIADGNVCSVY